MPQFTRGANIIRIDNEDFGVGLIKISRKCDVLDKVAKRTINGDLYREACIKNSLQNKSSISFLYLQIKDILLFKVISLKLKIISST